MRLGIYCGLANNMYVFAHALAAQGMDVCFIRDRSDRYPMSQPVWEDVAFTLPYEEVPRANSWPWPRWTELERELKWEAPTWLYDPLRDSNDPAEGIPEGIPIESLGVIDSYFMKRYLRTPTRSAALEAMRSCDGLLVSGIEGSLLAKLSGRPYIIWPFGGDIMVAAGLLQPKFYHLRTWLIHVLTRKQLVGAYASAICIGAHEPAALQQDFFGAEHFFRKQKVAHIPIPLGTRPRKSKGDRREFLEQLIQRLGFQLPPTDYIGFVPSRVDYQWKGQDRLLSSLQRVFSEGNATNIHIIFSGWGVDLQKARQFVKDNQLEGKTTFLNCALSKPLLYQFYQYADFVVDQFIVGMCGTSALEAMACGAPLITWLNEEVERPWGNPPVLRARTEADISRILRGLNEGCVDLETVGTSLQEWLGRNYAPSIVPRRLLELFSER